MQINDAHARVIPVIIQRGDVQNSRITNTDVTNIDVNE